MAFKLPPDFTKSSRCGGRYFYAIESLLNWIKIQKSVYSSMVHNLRLSKYIDPSWYRHLEDSFLHIIKKFNIHFNPKIDITHKMAVFHQWNQKPDRKIETYIWAYDVVGHADFPRMNYQYGTNLWLVSATGICWINSNSNLTLHWREQYQLPINMSR